MTCIQITDRNGLFETISSKERLKNYENTDFNTSQPYQKVLRTYSKDNDGKTISKLTTYHPNGQLCKYLELKDARAYGKYQEYYPSGNLKIDAFVIGGEPDINSQDNWLFDGLSQVYDENQTLTSQFTYQKGSLEGEAKYYHSNSQIKKLIPYQKNEIEGEVLEYKENGDLVCKTKYIKGKKQGTCIGYWGKDNIAFMEDYENDLLKNGQYFQKNRIKIASIKNGDGQKAIFKNDVLYQLIEHKGGFVDGKVKVFTHNGQLLNEHQIKGGHKQGEEVQYYLKEELSSFIKRENQPKFSIYWDEDAIQGQVKTWYKNGQLSSQKEYSKNQKNGLSCGWYENGPIMFIEEYENDRLIKGSYYKKDNKTPVSTIDEGNGIATIYDSLGTFIKKINYINGKPHDE
ncbi:MAG: hypothetical protein HZB76_03425 [Chlamydiae bacterium]|nr:hypothetical protein [Chlamydiota bacterium]